MEAGRRRSSTRVTASPSDERRNGEPPDQVGVSIRPSVGAPATAFPFRAAGGTEKAPVDTPRNRSEIRRRHTLLSCAPPPFEGARADSGKRATRLECTHKHAPP